RVSNVLGHSRAWRCGLRTGDVIVSVGDTGVEKARDISAYFAEFDFDKDYADLLVKRKAADGTYEEASVTVRWEKPVSFRVDGQWNRSEKTLHILARKVSSFTVRFSDEILKPGEPFHLFINDIPYQDLLHPDTVPDYVEPLQHDTIGHEELKKMRMERAKVEGWRPDPIAAIEDALELRDRGRLYGGKMTVDLKACKAGFEAAKKRVEERRRAKGERLKAAREKVGGAG
ncbi:MAG: hypothetical protein ACREID_05855, partial [Planctomycetota bacterium]